MAITRAQQYRQMLKDGKVAMQGGVKNYLGKQKTVTVPKDWQSSPDHPTTELAYITKAEKDLLLRKDLHNSLKGKPNRGPEGVMSLNGWGDRGDNSDRSFGGGERYDGGNNNPNQGGSGTGGDNSNKDTSGRKDTGTGNYQVDDQKAQDEYDKNRRKREAEEKKKRDEEAEKQRRKEVKEFTRNQKKRDAERRKAKLNAILSGKSSYTTQKYDAFGNPIEGEEETFGLGTNNKFGINDKEYQDLISSLPSGSSLDINPLETDAVNEEIRQKAVNDYLAKNIASTDLTDPLTQLMEKNDRFSGVNLEAFQNEFNLPKTGLTSLDVALGFAEPFLRKGSKKTKEFFSGTEDGLKNIFGGPRKSVLEAGKYTIDGMPISPEQFAMLDPALMDDVYGDYIGRRMSNEIDAYGNPTNLNTGGGDNQVMDPCKGPNPPAYCNVGNDDDDTTTSTRNFGGLAPRFMGSSFDFTGLADGGRAGMMDGGMMEDTPEGGIMDLESGRQMYFLGKLVKKATRAVKKVAKSPFGKAALGAALFKFGGGFGGGSGKGLSSLLSKGGRFLLGTKGVDEDGGTMGLLGKLGLTGGFGGFKPTLKGGLALGLGVPFALDALGVGKKDDEGFDIDEYYRTGGINIDDVRMNPYKYLSARNQGSLYNFADGGRTGYQEGGDAEPVAKKTMPLLDMNGMEKDYREDGGFVPIGRMERADDVPARLSKNEFVFTADAVRNAGDGDIDKGAEVMYNMMKNLESGGEVSEESQGLDGAREMFKTSQRLEEVL